MAPAWGEVCVARKSLPGPMRQLCIMRSPSLMPRGGGRGWGCNGPQKLDTKLREYTGV